MTSLRNLWAFAIQNLLLVGSAIISLAVVIWVVGSLALDFIHFNDPRHQDRALKGWMTPRYVVMSYDLPRPLVLELLQLERGERKMMRDIADEMGMTIDELTRIVRDAAARYRETKR